MSESLYEISSRFQYLFNLYEDDEDNDALLEELKQLSVDYSDKLENCVAYYKNLQAKSELFNNEAKRLKDKSSRFERKAEKLAEYINLCIADTDGTSKWSKGVHSISYRKSQKVEIDCLDLIPEVYLKRKEIIETDKIAIKEVLKQGGDIAGAVLETHFNLQIK